MTPTDPMAPNAATRRPRIVPDLSGRPHADLADQTQSLAVTVHTHTGDEVTLTFNLGWEGAPDRVPVRMRHQRGAPLDLPALLRQAGASLLAWSCQAEGWAPELRPVTGPARR